MIKNKIKKIIKHILYVFYSAFDIFLYKKKYNILDEKESVDKILSGNYSVSRFGDGEFKWIIGAKQNSFQDQNDELSKELLNALKSNNQKCLIGIPIAINDVSKYNFEARFYWKRFKFKYYKKLEEILDYDKEYINASFTRPYIDFKSKDDMGNKFDHIKEIWDKRKILIVEGEGVNFGCGNDLLNNAISIERIICPSKNAFNCIDKIYKSILKHYDNHLVLIALGPTASILSEKLSQKDIQAIDIGHLDVEYCWYKNGCVRKVDIVGKNVNEKNNEKAVTININYDEIEDEIIDVVKLSK